MKKRTKNAGKIKFARGGGGGGDDVLILRKGDTVGVRREFPVGVTCEKLEMYKVSRVYIGIATLIGCDGDDTLKIVV